MLPELLPDNLPAFYKMGTLADMSMMARKVALARKAIGEIRRIENFFGANPNNISTTDFSQGMKETGEYATVIANAINEAVVIMKDVKRKVESYQEEIHDATN